MSRRHILTGGSTLEVSDEPSTHPSPVAVGDKANARKRWMFLLTVAPLVVEGGTGSPVNPLATY